MVAGDGITDTKAAPAAGRPHTALGFGALVLGAIAMGASPVFVRLADVGPQASAFWRAFLALPFLWVWARWERRKGTSQRSRQGGTAVQSPPPLAGEGQGGGGFGDTLRSTNPLPIPPPQAGEGARGSARLTIDRDSKPLDLGSASLDLPILLAGLFFAGDLFFWHLAILGTTVANATFLATTMPVWVALGAVALLGQRVTLPTLAGLALCLAGGGALVGESFSFAPGRLAGDIFGTITALFFGGYMLAVRAARARHGAGKLAFVATAITAACLLIIAMFTEPTLIPRSASGFAALVALAVVSQVAGQGLLAVALGTLPATFSSLVLFFEAIAAAAFGWLILGEALGTVQLVGGVLILIGIWVARPREIEGTPAGP
jgi:drug/metabolite transporter (DMT)-like permease